MRNWHHTAVQIISVLLIVLFVYTAVSKLMNLASFQYVLTQSPLLQPYAILLSWLIPSIELAISIALTLPAFRKMGLAASFVLMIFFTVYIGWMLWSASRLPCSCGGVLAAMDWKTHFVFNGIVTLLALSGCLLEANRHLFYYRATQKGD